MYNMLKTLRFITNVSINTTRHYRQYRTKNNDGFSNTLGLMKESGYDGDINEDTMEAWDDSEGNLQDLTKLDKMHDKEKESYKEMIHNKIVARKYFQETFPNFLTWSEKEQIRFLHSEDPDKWNLSKICESFPITTEAAVRLLKAHWKPATFQRIARHDASALRNWKELKDNTFDCISSELREHLLTFSDRVIPPRNEFDDEKSSRLSTGDNPTGEYGRIIANYRKAIEAKYKKEIQSKSSPLELESKKTQCVKNNSKEYVLHSQLDVKKEDKDKNEIKPIVNEVDSIKHNSMELYAETYVVKPSNEDAKALQSKESDENAKIFEVLQKIKIPKEVWKKGATYKVKDCFYDYDGLFLYRVPGLLN